MTLSLSTIVQVDFNLAAPGGTRRGFDLGLIVGPSTVIDPADRVVVYDSFSAVQAAGFATTSVEYLAAQAYFAASSNPRQLAIGRVDTGETQLQAVTACRLANTEWYTVYCPGANDTDHAAIAAYIEALTEYPSIYMLQSFGTAIRNGDSGNLFEVMANADYDRTHCLYSSTNHEVARVQGYVAGAVSDAANSAFTLFGKILVGGTPEDLTAQQVANIQANNGNVYVDRGGQYKVYEQGKNASGIFFDQRLYRDKLRNEIQLSAMDALYGNRKIPQTENGMAFFRTKLGEACQKSVVTGYLAPGIWRGAAVPGVNTGDQLATGYFISSNSIASQPTADAAARKAPTTYIAVNEADAIHSLLIVVNVNT